MNSASVGTERVRSLTRLPLIIVFAALVLLALIPFILERVQLAHHATIERVLVAQATVNDLEEGIANTRLAIASGRLAAKEHWTDSAYAITARHFAAEEQVHADALRLVAQAAAMGPTIARRTDAIDSMLRAASVNGHGSVGTEDEALSSAGDAAAELERELGVELLAAQRQLAFVDTLNRDLALILVPVAIVAVVLVAQIGRRAVRAAQEAEEGRAALARAIEEKDVLIRGVTHDLKNPIGAAMAYAELLRDGIGTDDIGRRDSFLRSIEQLLRSALTTVSDLLDVARADSVAADVHRAATDLASIATSVAEGFRAKAESAGLALDTQIATGRATTVTDEARVRRIVENLLSNAVKFTPAGGRVSISVDRDDGQYVISVADTGPGIPETLRDRVFEEFYRVPGQSAPGAGIGLAISRKMARLLGGDIRTRPRPGGGTVFDVLLPADDLAVARSAKAAG